MRSFVHPRSVLILAVLVLVCSWTAATGDENQTRERWILKMVHGPLRTVIVQDATGESTSYHYMTIKVMNKTKFARNWHPLVKAITDTKKTYTAGGAPRALSAVRAREKNQGLVAIGTTAGKIAAGATLNTVAIFGSLDPLYDKVTVQIFGLVDQFALYKVEQYGEKSADGKVVLGPQSVIVDSAYWDKNQKILGALKKAAKESGGDMPQPHVEYQEVAESRYWSMDYERLGDEFHAEDDIIRFKREGWKIAGAPKGLRVISTEG